MYNIPKLEMYHKIKFNNAQKCFFKSINVEQLIQGIHFKVV